MKAEPIQYKPNENHPNPKNHPDKKVFFKEELRVIKYIPKPNAKINKKLDKGGIAKVAIAPEQNITIFFKSVDL